MLGQSFTIEALTAMSGEPADALRPRLAALVRREILALETDPRAPTRGQHAFVQGLLREVAFATLSKRERRTRHLAAARYFELLGDEEMAGAVATHFVEAYRAAPEGPEGEAVATQARISLLATAERASELGALGQAVDALRSALDVTPDAGQRARLLERIGRLQAFHSDWEDAYANLEAAVQAYTALGDRLGRPSRDRHACRRAPLGDTDRRGGATRRGHRRGDRVARGPRDAARRGRRPGDARSRCPAGRDDGPVELPNAAVP